MSEQQTLNKKDCLKKKTVCQYNKQFNIKNCMSVLQTLKDELYVSTTNTRKEKLFVRTTNTQYEGLFVSSTNTKKEELCVSTTSS